MSLLLTVKELSLAVGEKRILDQISFSLQKGKTFALVGESGSGKSLTALAIMRLLPPAVKVSGGDVLLHGSSLFGLPEFQMQKVRGRKIAMIFQEPMSALNPVMSIGEQVAEVLKIHLKLPASEAKRRVISLFEEVALPDASERYGWYPHQLSGGQKQRVMIAMALACEPDLLIADEPTTALDVTVQAQVLALLQKIKTERQLSILFITHDMAVVSEVADSVAVMRQGRIVETAEASHFFTAPQHPYTKRLLADALGEKGHREVSIGEKLLEMKDVKVYFPVKKGLFQRTVDHVRAVDGVSLSIDKGKTLALVGESGSGKSTLGQAILSLVPICGGEISFAGQRLNGLSRSALKSYRQKIQVIFQDPFSALDPRMSVGDILREGMESLGTGPKKRADQDVYLRELLQKVDLDPESLIRYPHEFSGGQRQRIGIARALAVEPELIICDEPTSALDVTVRAQVLSLLKKIQEETGLSYLFITHDLSLIETIADEVAVMREGKIIEQGKVREVMHYPSHPYTRTLLEAAPKLPDMKQREEQ
jgi:peptide/nickel transport system ATP-binding protein